MNEINPPPAEQRRPLQHHIRYPDYANPELLEKIPLAAKCVLDVGCGQGALGEAYLRRNPRARFLGIDIDPEAINHAGQRLSQVACVDVESTPMPFDIPEGLDCIIYGDLLEHLQNPWTLLRRQAEFLTPGGTVLVCMPNVEHWSFALRLLNGTFDYENNGLFDSTHLRWFTPRTMANALTGAGLELADVAPRPINLENASMFAKALAPGLRNLGIDPAEYFNRSGPLQFIWRARKQPSARIVLNATMLEPQGGVSDVRVIEPLRALRTDSSVFAEIMAEPELRPALPDLPKIALLHRPLLLGESGLERIRKLLRQNYIIVSEFDDHPVFLEQRGVPMDEFLTFRGVHAIQASTPALATALQAQNPEIAVFGNGIYELPEVHNFSTPNHLTLFFGAMNRGEDWAPYMPALNEISRAVGPRLRFCVVHDKAFFDALESPHKQFTPMCNYAQYLKLLSESDLAFMPLADTLFNSAKSDLKFIEAAASRVVSLASNTVYGHSIEDQKTGFLFHDAAQLRAHLLRILAYPEAARKIGDAARAYVAQQRMLAYQVTQRLHWYQTLWQRRDELNTALAARVPELFT